MDQWYCVINGQRYGPVAAEEIRQWLADNRIKSTDLVWREGMSEWAPLASLEEFQASASAAPSASYTPPPAPAEASAATGYAPHRGTMILVFGILSFVCCLIFGIVAWIMGNTDLREMDAGRMDPQGRGLTQAGKILGMVSVILTLVAIIIQVLMIVFLGSAPFMFQH